MAPVGSAKLYPPPVILKSAAYCSFSRPSWWASILASFHSALKENFGLSFFPDQEMNHGKETVLWQLELQHVEQ
jgi:hypothetical protein